MLITYNNNRFQKVSGAFKHKKLNENSRIIELIPDLHKSNYENTNDICELQRTPTELLQKPTNRAVH